MNFIDNLIRCNNYSIYTAAGKSVLVETFQLAIRTVTIHLSGNSISSLQPGYKIFLPV